MSRIYVPATSPNDWKQFLKDPKKHWKMGYSARTLAHCWHDADGLPREIHQLFADSDVATLRDVQTLLVIPELITPVAGRGEPPHSDIFVLAKANDNQLVTVTVEGKVDEDFGKRNQTVGSWKYDGDEVNRRNRLEFLLDKLALSVSEADDIAYQLIQRTASAVVEAEKFNARYAVMIVHSFSLIQSNWHVFHRFVHAFDKDIKPGQLVEVSQYKDITILVGWAQGDQRYLAM